MEKRVVLPKPWMGEIASDLADDVLFNQQLFNGYRKLHNVYLDEFGNINRRPAVKNFPFGKQTTEISIRDGLSSSKTLAADLATYAKKIIYAGDENIIVHHDYPQGHDGYQPIVSEQIALWYNNEITFYTDKSPPVAAADGAFFQHDVFFSNQFIMFTKGKTTTLGATPIRYADFFLTEKPNEHSNKILLKNNGQEYDDSNGPAFSKDVIVDMTSMLSRIIIIEKKYIYGSKIPPDENSLDPSFQITKTTEGGESVVTSSSGFKYLSNNRNDDGLLWVAGGSFLFAGSPKGVWTLSNLTRPLDAKAPDIRNHSSVGAYNVKAVDIDGAFLYFSSDGKTIRVFSMTIDSVANVEVNQFSKHLFSDSSPKKMLTMRTPHTIVFILKKNGNFVLAHFIGGNISFSTIEVDVNITDFTIIESKLIMVGNEGGRVLDFSEKEESVIDLIKTLDSGFSFTGTNGESYVIKGTDSKAIAREETVIADGTYHFPDSPWTNVEIYHKFKSIVQPPSFAHITQQNRGAVNRVHLRTKDTSSIQYGINDLEFSTDIIGDDIEGIPIGGGLDYDCSFTVGSNEKNFTIQRIVADIEVGNNR